MLETLLACSIFTCLGLCALVSAYCRWAELLRLGIATLTFGAVISCLAGIFYHFRLAQTMACRQKRVPSWWWSPTRLHDHLTPQEALLVLPWFWAGATGFILVVLGAVWALLAISVVKN